MIKPVKPAKINEDDIWDFLSVMWDENLEKHGLIMGKLEEIKILINGSCESYVTGQLEEIQADLYDIGEKLGIVE